MPPDSHFIAINAHAFHAPDAVLRAAHSVADAVALLRAVRIDPVTVILFHHAALPLPPPVRFAITSLGISLRPMPPGPNGHNLNRQIDMAMAGGHTLFYRVDGDDTVHPLRFVRQAALMRDDTIAISGGGLIYVDGKGARCVQPAPYPGPQDYLMNRAALHPTLCLRLSVFSDAALRYWPRRLEDKALIGAALASGLKLQNDIAIYGDYHLLPNTRSGFRFATLNLRLNLAAILACGVWRLLPLAVLLCLAGILIPSRLLRRLRDGRATPLQTRPSASPRKSELKPKGAFDG